MLLRNCTITITMHYGTKYVSVDVRGELCSSLGAACSEKGLAGAPDNEVDAEDAEDVEQRSCVVYLLWVGAGISARPRGCAPSAD